MTDRAVILARGLGTRMRRRDDTATMSRAQAEVAATGLKALIPIGRPFLDYGLSAVADAGMSRVCLVIGPEHDLVRRYYTTEAPPSRLTIDFAVQTEARGTADAVLAAEVWTKGESFLVLNSDNLYPVEALRALAALDEPGLVAFSRAGLLADGQIDPERIARFAVLLMSDGYLERIVEKPASGELAALGDRYYVSMNCWRFDARVFDACRQVPLSPRGELELPAAVGHAIDTGLFDVRALRVDAPVLDLSSQSDIAAVAARLASVEARP
jgi:glucose-1-phosphate thymidylyltransferase